MLKTIGATVLSFAMAAGWNAWSVPLFGVPLTVLMMAFAGSAIGGAYGTPIKDRKSLFITVAAHMFLATVCVAVFPGALGWDWFSPKLEAPLAGLLAFAARFALPAIPWGDIIRKVARLPPKQEGN